LRIERNAWLKNNGQGWIRRCGGSVKRQERPTLPMVAVIARSGPSSSPPTGSRASSVEHVLDHINIWINCCYCHSSSCSSIIFFFRDEELGWMDDETDDGMDGKDDWIVDCKTSASNHFYKKHLHVLLSFNANLAFLGC